MGAIGIAVYIVLFLFRIVFKFYQVQIGKPFLTYFMYYWFYHLQLFIEVL